MGKKEDEPMHDWESLSHVRWDCKYHVVFVPKYRQKKLYGKFRKKVGGRYFGIYAASVESNIWKGI
jgi:putative transposase